MIAAETAYQVWVNRCRIAHGARAWDEEKIKAKISFYVRLWLGRERMRLGQDDFKRIWHCQGFREQMGIIKFNLH